MTLRLRFSLVVLLLTLSACTGSTGPAGPQGPPGDGGPTDTHVALGDSPPGVHVTILSLTGATGAGGAFQVGNTIAVKFKLTKDDGSAWQLSEMSTARMMVSGPSFNYQRVIPEVSDLVAASVAHDDDTYTYTFATPIPATYAPPVNDTPAFGPGDGELSGQPLLDGTYTLGCTFAWNYTVGENSFKDVANNETDFLFGGAAVLEPREVVKQDNCAQCHAKLQAHGGSRQDVKLCLLCHTAGAEDENDPAVGGGTPGVTVDFRVLIHKLHNGSHLPSVLGVATNPDGSRNYAATPTPYLVAGNSLDDFSGVAFPVWPNAQVPMPRDQGYSALPPAAQAQEDAIRSGVASCAACHGDPDGAGPLTPPAQGDIYKTQPSRGSCGSCHDDVNWGSPYTSNGQTMGAQANNSNCILCHAPSGNALAVEDAHRHPLQDPTFNTGVNVNISGLTEAGTNNGNGAIDPGEKIAITFTIHDDSGADIDPATLSSASAVISGPTSNYNILANSSIPLGALASTGPYTINVPQPVVLEFVGRSTGSLNTFTTSMNPIWTPANLTSVFVRTGTTGSSSRLAAASSTPQNYVDVLDSTGFAHDDYIVIDDGQPAEEYLRIQGIDGDRLFFSSPYTPAYAVGPRVAHAAGATVRGVTLDSVPAANYTINAPAGQITETTEFGVGDDVLVSYTTDFVMPAVYPVALNGSPDLDEISGKWTAKPIVAGTYSIGVWASESLTLNLYGESNSYKATSTTQKFDFLVGDATTIEPYQLISSGDNCAACHKDVGFHGYGRRGYDSCVLCHGTAGSEDRPQYVAADAPATTGVTVNFRTMLHKIHRGADLAHASTYTVVGFGGGAWPDNFSTATYGDVVFPAMPSGVQSCATCHGDSNTAWIQPSDRNHPTDQNIPVLGWTFVCGSCHDSDSATAHIQIQTSPSGVESCDVCHAPGRDWAVEKEHKVY